MSIEDKYEKIVQIVWEKSKIDTCYDDPDFIADFGCNQDDAYQAGLDDGGVSFAREILDIIIEGELP